LQELNRILCEEYPSVMTIADGVAAHRDVTVPAAEGGLGFTFCRNYAWADGAGTYMACDPIYRQYMHDKLITPAVSAHDESGVLSIPRELVSGGRGSLVSQMYGGYEEKFAAMRAFFTYMMTFPGKKYTFMGCELAQFREWNPGGELEWYMIKDYSRHTELHDFIKMLNSFYLSQPSLWELDGEEDGFIWQEPNDKERNVVAYRRIARDRSELLVVINFSPVPHKPYRLSVPADGRYKVLFSTDGLSDAEILRPKKIKEGRGAYSCLDVPLSPYSAQILEKIPTSKTNP
jgi:1,4-alpha-glucan branching enzyme